VIGEQILQARIGVEAAGCSSVKLRASPRFLRSVGGFALRTRRCRRVLSHLRLRRRFSSLLRGANAQRRNKRESEQQLTRHCTISQARPPASAGRTFNSLFHRQFDVNRSTMAGEYLFLRQSLRHRRYP
jgi:hypothetical protein